MELSEQEKNLLSRMFEYLDYPEHWDDICEENEIEWEDLREEILELKHKLLM